MPLYFFNRTDGHSDIDQDGTELPDLKAARLEAVHYLAQTMRDHPADIWEHDGDLKVEVLDETRLVLCTVTVMTLDAPGVGSSSRAS